MKMLKTDDFFGKRRAKNAMQKSAWHKPRGNDMMLAMTETKNKPEINVVGKPVDASSQRLTDILKERINSNDATLAVGLDDNWTASQINNLRMSGLDLVELRIDLFGNLDTQHILNKISELESLATIATIRLAEEGGESLLSTQERVKIFSAILPTVDAIDVELCAEEVVRKLQPQLMENDTDLVISFHDFEKTPSLNELRQIYASAISLGADIVKISTKINSPEDRRTLANLLVSSLDKNLIVVGMGAKGVATRLTFPALGSLLTFASTVSLSTAPGQIHVSTMFDFLRIILPKYNERKIIELELLEFV